MKLYNIIDEQERFLGLRATLEPTGPQFNTHTYSYLHSRKLYQEMGEVMGLDRLALGEKPESRRDIT